MKILKNISLIIIISVLILMLYNNAHYEKKGIVIANMYGILIEDENGEVWEFDDIAKKYPLGTEVVMVMVDNGTSSYIYDDIIESVYVVD